MTDIQDEFFDKVENYRMRGKNILFTFVEETSNGVFTNKTASGIQVRNKTEDVKTPRWAKVQAAGTDVPSHVVPGSYVLIEQLMWSDAYKIGEEKMWSTSMDKVIASSVKEPTGLF